MPLPTLHVLTPVSRPRNVRHLAASLEHAEGHIKLVWHIRFDPKRESVYGYSLRNAMIQEIHATSRAWIWCLDDDNIAMKQFFEHIQRAIQNNPKARAIVMSQQVSPNSIRMAHPTSIRITRIDLAQVVLRRDLLVGREFEHKHDADGLMFESLYKCYPRDFIFLKTPLCFYNRLEW